LTEPSAAEGPVASSRPESARGNALIIGAPISRTSFRNPLLLESNQTTAENNGRFRPVVLRHWPRWNDPCGKTSPDRASLRTR
jgi:hypothetical protein